MIYSDYVSREQLRALLILICSSVLIIFTVCAHSADSLQHHCESSELEPYWRSSQGFFLTWKKKHCHPPPSLRAFVIKAWHKCFKGSTEELPWLQSHPVGLAMCWAFLFSSVEMKIHMAELSEPSFYNFKARLNPQERQDLYQMAVWRISQALLTFTICLSDLSNKDAAFWK